MLGSEAKKKNGVIMLGGFLKVFGPFGRMGYCNCWELVGIRLKLKGSIWSSAGPLGPHHAMSL